MARRGFHLALLTFSALAAFLTAPLPACAEKSAARQQRDVEVDLGVLDEIRPYAEPQALPPPSQPLLPNVNAPLLTAPDTDHRPQAKAIEELRPEALLEHPGTVQTTPSPLSWSEPVPKPARKPYIDRAIKQPEFKPDTKLAVNAEAASGLSLDSAPLPVSAPTPELPVSEPPISELEEPAQALPEENISVTPPLPPRRPAKVHASESFVREARQNYETEQLKPVKPLPVEEAPLEAPPAPAPGLTEENPLPESGPTDPLEAALIKQTPRDVLASIDPAAHLPPPPSAVAPPAVSAAEPVLLGYKPGVTALPEKIQALLHERILLPLQKSEDMDIQITAYASVIDDRQNSDRRIALERALAVRDFFTGKGISQERLHIRALGKETDIEPLDRVEIILNQPSP